MRSQRVLFLLFFALVLAAIASASDPTDPIKKAVEKSTLDQAGTRPFHLKADVAPSFDRDKDSGRTGKIEIWWSSPTQWRREVRSPGFHQIDIFNGPREWQKNEGDYFPEWLREVAVALIDPVPDLDHVLEQARGGEVKRIFGQIAFSWVIFSTDGTVKKSMGAGISLDEKTGLLMFGTGFGWSGDYKDYKSFHGRMVGRTVESGSPQVTAKITTLEDLGEAPPNLFDTETGGGDQSLLKTVLLEETELRKYLLTKDPVSWPSLRDGPLEGIITTEIVVDREGKVRQIASILSDNPGLSEDAGRAIVKMRFKPYLQNGVPVQVVSRITMPFKTVRPAGVESFDSARNYFERGRQASFPAAKGPAYSLHATFKAKVAAGTVEDGEYIDTWIRADEWRREAKIGKGRLIRTQDGDKRYLLADGPDTNLLRLVFQVLEPIPALDTFVESDWRIKRDEVEGVKTIRVLSGYESPDGELDPEHARGYWFDENARLVKSFFSGLEVRPSGSIKFGNAELPQQIRVLRNGSLGLFIQINDISPAATPPEGTFRLPGHEWKRAFTSEVR